MSARASCIPEGRPWAQTATGRAVDLIFPKPAQIWWPDVAESLAKIPRFNGHTPNVTYSVAQHCILGADYLEGKFDGDTALAFLLHDAHEYLIGDRITPVQRAVEAYAAAAFPDIPQAPLIVRQAETAMRAEIDRAIFTAAALPYPLPAHVAKAVKETDLALMMAERARHMARPPQSWGAALEAVKHLPIRGKFFPMPPGEAQIQWLIRLKRFRPSLAIYG